MIPSDGAWSYVVREKSILEMETTQAKDMGIKRRSSLEAVALIANFGAKFLLLVACPVLQQLHGSAQPRTFEGLQWRGRLTGAEKLEQLRG